MNYTIVGLGDSITEATTQMPDENQRWLKLLERKLEHAFPEDSFWVVNAGVGGNSDREKMARFDQDVLAHDPDIVLLEFGGNNSDPNKPERRVSLPEARECLEQAKAGLLPKTRIMVITFPPLLEEQHAYYGHEFFEQFGGLEASLERYRQQTRDFAVENNFPLADFGRELKSKMAVDGGNTYILPDGVHLTAAGNEELAELVFFNLKKGVL